MELNKEIDICEKISSEVRNTFLQIYKALKSRETQLLRQIEVLSQHYKLNESYDRCFKQVTIIFDNEGDVLSSIANFGRIDFNGLSSDSDFYKVEEYQRPECDHVSLYKYIENSCADQLNKSTNLKLDAAKEPPPASEEGACTGTSTGTDPDTCSCNCDAAEAHACERARDLSAKQDVQLQQWMKQIQAEPEVEPAPSHVMEHSNISPPRLDSV